LTQFVKPPTLNLVVLRSAHIKGAAAFYSLLGLEFKTHRHGGGVEHLSAELPGSVFELYPLTDEGSSTTGTRLGFAVTSLDAVISALQVYPGAIISPAKESPWGRRAVVVDPDGHKIELVEVTECC
jgi:lactoylglutathione lyase